MNRDLNKRKEYDTSCLDATWSQRKALYCLYILIILVGCSSDTVTEDRSISVSANGNALGFQHGESGIYVVDVETSVPKQLFRPDDDTIAISTPLYSHLDSQLIFTVARPTPAPASDTLQNTTPNNTTNQFTTDSWDASPDGRRFARGDITYTCMHVADGKSQPEELFTARCDHSGYVAANLAVRWHADGKRILYIDTIENGQLALFAFDLTSRTARQLLDRPADAMAFVWSPNHQWLACIIMNQAPNSDALLISQTGESWFQVEGYPSLAGIENTSALERLRSSLPVWSKADAFCAARSSSLQTREQGKLSRVQHLSLVNLDTLQFSIVQSNETGFRDLHWSAGGEKLGFIGDNNTLQTLAVETNMVTTLREGVRHFVGWNFSGEKFAYIRANNSGNDSTNLSVLLRNIPNARDSLLLANSDGAGDDIRLLSGLRITFPSWSPDSDHIQFWGTYTPSHHNVYSATLPWGLHPGDPVAKIDTSTGELTWLPISSSEEQQIGNFNILHQDYEQAWKWYTTAGIATDSSPQIKLSQLSSQTRGESLFRTAAFFEYICLQKIQRRNEALRQLEVFDRQFRFDPQDAKTILRDWGYEIVDEEPAQHLIAYAETLIPYFRANYEAEVFLSLDLATTGIAHFDYRLQQASQNHEELSALIAKCHLYLAANNTQAFAEVAVGPLAEKLLESETKVRVPPSSAVDSGGTIGYLADAIPNLAALTCFLPLMDNRCYDGWDAANGHTLQTRLLQLLADSEIPEQRYVILRILRVCRESLFDRQGEPNQVDATDWHELHAEEIDLQETLSNLATTIDNGLQQLSPAG